MSQHPGERPEDPRRPDRPSRQGRSCSPALYRVVLQHDPATDLMAVVRAVMELMRFCRDEATYKMWSANHSGRACLLTTHRERAELYVEQFADRGVRVTIEPA